MRVLTLPSYIKKTGQINIELIKEIPIINFYPHVLRKSGRLLMGKCPFHDDSSASFFIYPSNTWHCFGCGEGKDIIDFIMKLKNIDFKNAINLLSHGNSGT